MNGITDLKQLLSTMQPDLAPEEFVFCTFRNTRLEDRLSLDPIGAFRENEGWTLVIEKSAAQAHEIPFDICYRKISLTVHSSLVAVGLTAAIAQQLAQHDISANVIAAYYHDHVFVPASDAERALAALKDLQESSIR